MINSRVLFKFQARQSQAAGRKKSTKTRERQNTSEKELIAQLQMHFLQVIENLKKPDPFKYANAPGMKNPGLF